MWKNCRHLRDLQLLTKDLLTVEATLNAAPLVWEDELPLLAADCLRASGRLRLCVRGESMLPTLWPGGVVEITACGIADVQPGNVVLALRGGRFFLHRFMRHADRGRFVLRGDSMPSPDPEFPAEALIGRLNRRAPLQAWSRAIGVLFCYCGPLRRLALGLRSRLERLRQGPRSAITHAPLSSTPLRGRGRPRCTSATPELTDAGA